MKLAVGIMVLLLGLIIGVLLWRDGGPPVEPSAAPLVKEPVSPQSASVVEPPEGVLLTPSAQSENPRAAVPLPQAPPEIVLATEGITLVRVHVLSAEDRRPLAGVRLILLDYAYETSFGSYATGIRGSLHMYPTTGEDGRAEFEVEPGHQYSVSGGPAPSIIVGPLAAGQQIDVELLIPTRTAFELFGILVEEENSKPIAGGRVQVAPDGDLGFHFGSEIGQETSPAELSKTADPTPPTGLDGRFVLRGDSWSRRHAQATAPGFARIVFELAPGASDQAHPLEVRMSRSAILEVTVRDGAGGGIADVRVELSTSSYYLAQEGTDYYIAEDPSWSASTDALGRATVIDLPPRVPVKLVVKRAGVPAREEAEPLSLEPGERRAIEIILGSGGTIQGQVVDGAGKPVAHQALWRIQNEWALPVMFESYEEPAATAQTDSSGHFTFEDVTVGIWCVGIAPDGDDKDRLPAYAEPVEVRTPGDVVELVLRVDAGLHLRGKVIDSAGSPVANCFVWAMLVDSNAAAHGSTDDKGEFELGPLPRGNWQIVANPAPGDQAPSLPVEAPAGADGVLVQLRAGGSIAGSVKDGKTLQPAECELVLFFPDEDTWTGLGTKDGTFMFKGLVPGNYIVTARHHSGIFGRSELIRVAAGQAILDVRVTLVRAAKLRLRHAGSSKAIGYTMASAGVAFHSDGIEGKGSADEVVPPGVIEVRWFDFLGEIIRTETITLAAGDVRELVWDGKP